MADIIVIGDLPGSVRDSVEESVLQMMVDGLNARAVRLAPCLAEDDPSPGLIAEAKLILVGVVKRWAEAGSGAFTQQTAGSFSVSMDTRQKSGWNLWPTEIGQLQDLCKQVTGEESKPFMVDMTGLGSPSGSLGDRPDLWFQWCHPAPPDAP